MYVALNIRQKKSHKKCQKETADGSIGPNANSKFNFTGEREREREREREARIKLCVAAFGTLGKCSLIWPQ